MERKHRLAALEMPGCFGDFSGLPKKRPQCSLSARTVNETVVRVSPR
jgi:hypothetical protein